MMMRACLHVACMASQLPYVTGYNIYSQMPNPADHNLQLEQLLLFMQFSKDLAVNYSQLTRHTYARATSKENICSPLFASSHYYTACMIEKLKHFDLYT